MSVITRWEEITERNLWDGFLSKSQQGTVYDTWRWRNVLESEGFRPLYLGAFETGGNLTGVCPLYYTRYHWLFRVLNTWPPFAELSGPILAGDESEHTEEAMNALLSWIPNSLRLAGLHIRTTDKQIAEHLGHLGYKIHDGTGFFLVDLDKKPLDSIWRRAFKKDQRREIRYFDKRNMTSRVGSEENELHAFYKLYKESMLRHGYGIAPLSFFVSVRNNFPESFKIFLIQTDEGAVATTLLLDEEKKTIHLPFVGYEQPKSNRSLMLYCWWKVLTWAGENGYRFVNMGNGSSRPTQKTYLFKKQFGGDFIIRYWVMIYTSPLLRLARWLL
jgi:predicted N-acyltransferase